MNWTKVTILFMTLFCLNQFSNGKKCLIECHLDDELICVTEAMRCDQIQDCDDLEDETDCPCRGFECFSDKECIGLNHRCDGMISCKDATDELNCTLEEYKHNKPDAKCEMPCEHGECEFLSVGNKTSYCSCQEGFHGYFCELHKLSEEILKASVEENQRQRENSFDCNSTAGVLIPKELVCDGKVDCQDSLADETNCKRFDYEARNLPKYLDDGRGNCWMPCQRGTCQFSSEGIAHCKCDRNRFTGILCEKLITNNDDNNNGKNDDNNNNQEQQTTEETDLEKEIIENLIPSDSVEESSEREGFKTMVLFPVIAIAMMAILLWLIMTKPWSVRESPDRARLHV